MTFIPLQIHLETVYMGDEGLQLPCKFYDMSGITEKTEIEDIEKIIDASTHYQFYDIIKIVYSGHDTQLPIFLILHTWIHINVKKRSKTP